MLQIISRGGKRHSVKKISMWTEQMGIKMYKGTVWIRWKISILTKNKQAWFLLGSLKINNVNKIRAKIKMLNINKNQIHFFSPKIFVVSLEQFAF